MFPLRALGLQALNDGFAVAVRGALLGQYAIESIQPLFKLCDRLGMFSALIGELLLQLGMLFGERRNFPSMRLAFFCNFLLQVSLLLRQRGNLRGMQAIFFGKLPL